MDKKPTLLRELKEYYEELKFDFEESGKEIQESIGSEKVIGYYLSRGPLPDFPETLMDIFILTKKFLYNFEMREKGLLRHIVPLHVITSIAEAFAERENENFLSITIRYGGLHVTALQDKLINKKHLRKFTSEIKTIISETE